MGGPYDAQLKPERFIGMNIETLKDGGKGYKQAAEAVNMTK
jgi:hypothetical protein